MRIAFDIIGSKEKAVAIVEKDGKAAKEIISKHKNIKSVLQKKSARKGIYRIYKFKLLAGSKNTEVFHKEHGCVFKLDPRKTYFSPREATERQRIAKKVKGGEKILVMFSGVAPLPISILKQNPEVGKIYGIEINPSAHEYAAENLKLNKINPDKIVLINDDVKKTVECLIDGFIGLKAHLDKGQLKAKLLPEIKLLEIYLANRELENKLGKIENAIEDLKRQSIKIVVHQPRRYNNELAALGFGNEKNKEATRQCVEILYKLAKKHDNVLGFIMHPHWGRYHSHEYVSNKFLIENIKELERKHPDILNYMRVENVYPFSFSRLEDILNVIKKAKIRNMCVDLAHAFITCKSNKKLYKLIKEIKKICRVYFHITDAKHNPVNGIDGVEIGKGSIDFEKIKNFLDFGVLEIVCKNEKKPVEAIRSYHKFAKLRPLKFDRIIMPLPEKAWKFLDTAFFCSKKGTIIHLYGICRDFKELEEKIKNAAKKCKKKIKILERQRVLPYAPRVWKVRMDIKIL